MAKCNLYHLKAKIIANKAIITVLYETDSNELPYKDPRDKLAAILKVHHLEASKVISTIRHYEDGAPEAPTEQIIQYLIDGIKPPRAKLWYIGWRGNPQLPKGGYWVSYGQLSKAEAKRKEQCAYGTMTLYSFETYQEYADAIKQNEITKHHGTN